MRRAAAAIALAAVFLLAGCGLTRGPEAPLGPPVMLDALRTTHNAWADSIPHLWARADITLNLPPETADAKPRKEDLSGHLFLVKPDRLYVHGEMLGQEVFAIGMNAEQFWLWVRPQVNTVWVGRRGGPGEQECIIAPSALLEALGVFSIAARECAESPWRLEEFGPQVVLSEDARGKGNTGQPIRRIWFDRRTLRPQRIDLYDAAGRRRLMAELLKFERVGAIDVCTVYRARFYGFAGDAGGEAKEVDLVLRLRDVRLDKEPNPKIFEYHIPPGATEKNLDTDADPQP